MRASIIHFFPCPFSEESSAHEDRLHLFAWLCDRGLSWHAHRMARASSPAALLADLHTSGAPRTPHLGRDGPVDAHHRHRLALRPLAQSDVLERPSPRELVGTGVCGHLAATRQWGAVPVWRWQSCRQTRHQESGGAERPDKPASPLVFWPALCAVDGSLGRLSCTGRLSAHSAQAPHRLSQRKCAVSRDGQRVYPTAVGAAGGGRRGCRLWLPGENAYGARSGSRGHRTPLGLRFCHCPHLEDGGRENDQTSRDPCAAPVLSTYPSAPRVCEQRP